MIFNLRLKIIVYFRFQALKNGALHSELQRTLREVDDGDNEIIVLGFSSAFSTTSKENECSQCNSKEVFICNLHSYKRTA